MAETESLKIPGYEFWVESNEKRMKQYRIQRTVEQDGNMISCYIASNPGAEFCVGIRKRKNGQSTIIKSYLDGNFVLEDTYKTSWAGDAYVSYLRTGNTKRGFAFSAINFTAALTITEDKDAELAPIPKDLGTIRLDVIRIKNLRYYEGRIPSPSFDTDLPTDIPTFSEKLKAENFHTISMQEPEEVESSPGPPAHYQFRYLDPPEKSPWYTTDRAREREKRKLDRQSSTTIKDESPETIKSQEPPVLKIDSDEEDKQYSVNHITTLSTKEGDIKEEDIEPEIPSSSKRPREPSEPVQVKRIKRV
ncbi:hypothetical protein Clacol_006153 [Clathrus columnatus]|uniref:DUF7918 domain-containing protein n=1 Tax=Clathrus columnatus TaxID=1419009 RepID=A0AAV5AG89_9AGAM|nr:hypothetical protein Clacol_006153 [Clathrus columnatus]